MIDMNNFYVMVLSKFCYLIVWQIKLKIHLHGNLYWDYLG